ncbi:MAG: hypothetical protein KDK64_02240 [Chlamydiia bacterium]|nr:hypothetical protein [Chlamydiia bacterium]
MDKGVLTGCNAEQEWMLKWWWRNYSKHNDYPVTFCDFGMSPGAKNWCAERGTLLHFDPESLALKKNLSANWAKQVSLSTWNKRALWFSKALILSKAPYEKSIWTDIDCEILKNLSSLFELVESKDGFAIAYDSEENAKLAKSNAFLDKSVPVLQAGVFAFKKNSPVIPAWIDYCLSHLETEASDQTAISHLQAQFSFDITILSNKYNWLTPEYPSPHIVINHHTGASRKRKLLAEMEWNG